MRFYRATKKITDPGYLRARAGGVIYVTGETKHLYFEKMNRGRYEFLGECTLYSQVYNVTSMESLKKFIQIQELKMQVKYEQLREFMRQNDIDRLGKN